LATSPAKQCPNSRGSGPELAEVTKIPDNPLVALEQEQRKKLVDVESLTLYS